MIFPGLVSSPKRIEIYENDLKISKLRKKTMKMSDLEKTEIFDRTEQRLLDLKKKLENRIDRTEVAMIEAKKISKEIDKIRKEKKANKH